MLQPVEEKAQRGFNQYLSNSSKEDRARPFSVVLADRTEDNDHKLKYMRVHLNAHKKIIVRMNAETGSLERLLDQNNIQKLFKTPRTQSSSI